MSQESNNSSQWPKAAVAILGTISICAVVFLLKETIVLWGLVALWYIVNQFD